MSNSPDLRHATLDAENPWPGLHEFDERGKEFFNGRDSEIRELLRLVDNASLTVLFGGSGLGKTSLLLAGLLPALREVRRFPVYVRLDPRDRGNALIEQARGRLFAELEAAKVEHPSPGDGESLWQYLHRAELELWSHDNQLLVPVFVFDQFEEVFTLGSDNAAAVQQLRDDLADLVENRVPTALARRLEVRDPDLASIDLLSLRCRVVLSFREDFLPDIEAWRQAIPSLARNRLRLLPMSGRQAYDAVLKTGGHLVEPAIAESIVRFVAAAQGANMPGLRTVGSLEREGPDELEVFASLTIEPALLSLVCTGLNDRRRAAGKSVIDSALISGTGLAIVVEFYEGCVRDAPPQTRGFIEDHLITEGGYRETYPKSDALSQGYISDADLKTLVDRRLLRVEPHLGAPRIELVHDLLTAVVRRSRDTERERKRKAEAADRDRRYRLRQYGLGAVAALAIVVGAVLFSWWRSTEEAFDKYKTEQAKRIVAEVALKNEQAKNESIKLLADADKKRAAALSLAARDDYVQARQLLGEALTVYRQMDDKSRTCRALVDRGKAYASEGNYELAAADFAVALTDATAYNLPDLGLFTVEAEGALQRAPGASADMTAVYRRALAKVESAGDSATSARVLEWIGNQFALHGELDRSAESLARALKLFESTGDSGGAIRVQRALARTMPWGYLLNLKTNSVYDMKGDRVTVGRDAEGVQNDISFTNNFVSRRHLVINREGFQTDDLRSRNGTSINGEMLAYGRGQRLSNADILILANEEALQFFSSAPAPLARPPRAWAFLVDGSPKQPIYLTEESYSIRISEGGLGITLGISETALANIRVVGGRIEMLARGGDWALTFILKESDYDYRRQVLRTGQWFEFPEFPPMKFAKLSADGKSLVTDGPSFQIFALRSG